jgi:hypothetical protein
MVKPRRGWFQSGGSGSWGDPEIVHPAGKGEVYPLFAMGALLSFVALMVCYSKGYLLLYGDAVAHLAIARRIVDAQYPGLAQLGGVWLPLPHLLMLPFIRNMTMWQTGLAAAPMSMLSYSISVAGMWRLSRRLMRVRWAVVATVFYALNPNLLFLATTAMTEALFLALFVWVVVATMEGVSALRAGNTGVAGWRMVLAGLMVLGMVFTRYDGWIVGAAVWLCFTWAMSAVNAQVARRAMPIFVLFTVMCVSGPLLWFWYNAHFEHDWLDFMRGPYSAAQIERRTAPPGQHYREWHHPLRAIVFYTRTAQIDASFWETGFGVMAAALYGIWLQLRKPGIRDLYPALAMQKDSRAVGAETADLGGKFALLLWLPLPFYLYSVAYGSVPIFIPQLYPHSYYNARYGMEMLPALAVYGALAAERLDVWLRSEIGGWGKLAARFWQPAMFVLCILNCIGMMYRIPLVLKEGMVNASTRVSFERSIALVLDDMPANEPVMMALSAHVGAVQSAGRTLKSMVSENDSQSFDAALAAPATHAAFVVAIEGDPVAKAVAEHPEGLKELEVICTTGQPCARIFQSDLWKSQTTQ